MHGVKWLFNYPNICEIPILYILQWLIKHSNICELPIHVRFENIYIYISKGLQCALTAIIIVALWQLPLIYIYQRARASVILRAWAIETSHLTCKSLGKQLFSCRAPRQDGLGGYPKI